MADDFARRNADRGGRRKAVELKPTKFNIRPRQSEAEDDFGDSNNDDEDQPKRKGRPAAKKEKDFEEMLAA